MYTTQYIGTTISLEFKSTKSSDAGMKILFYSIFKNSRQLRNNTVIHLTIMHPQRPRPKGQKGYNTVRNSKIDMKSSLGLELFTSAGVELESGDHQLLHAHVRSGFFVSGHSFLIPMFDMCHKTN